MKTRLLILSFLVFISTGIVNAESAVWWSGAVLIKVRITSVNTENGEVIFFQKNNGTLDGILYVDPEKKLNPLQLGSTFESSSPCYAGFISIDRANEIWICDGNYIWTDNPKSKNEKFLFIGTGTFLDHDANLSAAIYIDASGMHKKDAINQIQSIAMKAKIGAGMRENETFVGYFVLNGQFNGTLYREEVD